MKRQEYKRLARLQIRGRMSTLIGIELIYATLSSSVFLSPIVLLGYHLIFIKMVEGRAPQFPDLFCRTERYWKTLRLNLLTGCLIFIWSLLLIVPGIIKALSYSMAAYVLAENPHMSEWDAMEYSESLMKGHKMELFVLFLSFAGWILLGILTFGIALLFVVPYMQATMANFYVSLRGPKYSAQETLPIWL